MKRTMLSRKNILKAAWILFAVTSLVIWVPKIDEMVTNDYEQIKNYVALDDSWNVIVNDKSFENVSLGTFQFPAVNKGDRIVMERTLPEQWEVMQASLRISIRHSATRVYIDDELIYEYGFDRLEKSKTVGSGYRFINFPSEYRGRTLKISLHFGKPRLYQAGSHTALRVGKCLSGDYDGKPASSVFRQLSVCVRACGLRSDHVRPRIFEKIYPAALRCGLLHLHGAVDALLLPGNYDILDSSLFHVSD